MIRRPGPPRSPAGRVCTGVLQARCDYGAGRRYTQFSVLERACHPVR